MSRRLFAPLGFGAVAAVSLAMMAAPVPAARPAPRYQPGPGEVVLEAGQGIHGEYEPSMAFPDANIADLNAAGDQHRYALEAAGLPAARSDLKWENVGPFGQDDPTDYPTGSLRFARSAGMGSTIAADPRDASGNSVYVGNMGGLWHSTDGGAKWTNLTDGKVTRSAVGAVAVDPKDPETIYVGTGIGYLTTSGDAPGSGIWVSHDAGKTFQRPNANIKGYAVNEIIVLPDGDVAAATSNGLYASTDKGASFQRVKLPNNAAHDGEAKGAYANWISAVAVNPLDPKDVIAAVGLGQGKRPGPTGDPLSPGNGLYRSSAGVAGPYEYMESTSELTHEAASDDPVGRIMLAWLENSSGDGSVLWAIVSDAGLAYGKNPTGEPGDLAGETTGQTLNATGTELNGLYRSDDAGATFVNKATPQTLSASPNEGLGIYPALGYGVGVQASYNLWVEADPRNPDQVFLGLEEVFQSVAGTEEGPTKAEFEIIQRYWDVCGSTTYLENLYKGTSCPEETPYYGGTSTHPDQHWAELVELPDGNVRMYTANDGGFFRQDSHNLTDTRNAFDNDAWTEMNTIPTVQPWKIARKPDGEYLTALQDNGGGFFEPGKPGILVSSGDGVNAVATSDPDTWYMSAQGAIIYVTQDHGKTIRAIPADLAGAAFLSPLAIDPNDENHLVVAGRDVHETLLGPDTKTTLDPLLYTPIQTDWKQSFDAGNSPTMVNGAAVPYGAQAIAVRGGAIYVAICGLCRNTLGDPTLVHATVATNVGNPEEPDCEPKPASPDCWHVKDAEGLPHNSIWNLAIDPDDVKTIYVVLNNNSQIGYDPKVGGRQRVMVSKDAGATFQDITGNLPRAIARDVVVRGDQLIVGTDNGVFTAPKSGKSWSRLGGGLPQTRVFDLDLDPSGRYLTASVYGRGVWSLDFKKTARGSATPDKKKDDDKGTGRPRGGNQGQTPNTGLDPALAALATLSLAAAVVTRRRHRRSAPTA